MRWWGLGSRGIDMSPDDYAILHRKIEIDIMGGAHVSIPSREKSRHMQIWGVRIVERDAMGRIKKPPV